MRDFRKYVIWQKAIELTDRIYSYTDQFPKSEIYSLSNQIQRAVVSIASNIAEGSSRTSEKDFAHFLEMSIGSAFEVETQLTIAQRRGYISKQQYDNEIENINTLEKQINIFILKSATYRVSWEFTCKTTKILLLYIFLGHNRNVVNTKFPYPIKRLEVIRRFNQKSMAFNQSLS